ncbi:MAG: DUF488 family protein, partial [Rhodospirillales bacterium]|nr:DUF488 family protein [Rhodospirillales bacterium]
DRGLERDPQGACRRDARRCARRTRLSKTALAQACNAAKRGDLEAFRRIYRDRLEGKAAQAGLAAALEVASGSGAAACLLCCERQVADCHGAIVAAEMARQGKLCASHQTVRQGLA